MDEESYSEKHKFFNSGKHFLAWFMPTCVEEFLLVMIAISSCSDPVSS